MWVDADWELAFEFDWFFSNNTKLLESIISVSLFLLLINADEEIWLVGVKTSFFELIILSSFFVFVKSKLLSLSVVSIFDSENSSFLEISSLLIFWVENFSVFLIFSCLSLELFFKLLNSLIKSDYDP